MTKRRVGRRRRDGGNVAVIVATVLPVIAVTAAGATELAFVWADRSKLQDAADAAALASASQLTIGSEASALERAQNLGRALAEPVARNATVTVTAAALKNAGRTVGVKVDIESTRPSFFGDLLPPGGFKTHVSSSAVGMNSAPLCVFGTQDGSGEGVLVNSGAITATGCVVHANNTIRAATGGTISAAVVQAAGTVSGVTGGRQGAEVVADPFVDLKTAPASWTDCADKDLHIKEYENRQLAPGVHCGTIQLEKSATLTLKEGAHYFPGQLELKVDAKVVGQYATMIVGPKFVLKLDAAGTAPSELDKVLTRWDLLGSRTGDFAGLVFVVDRARTTPLKMPARMVTRMEGVVYAPSVEFEVYGGPAAGGGQAAEQSAWTVLVGKDMRVTSNAKIDLNTDYAASQVPVPAGVGNKAKGGGGQRLVN